MRVAIIETQPFGGLLHYAVQLGDALAARSHQVDLVTARGNELVGRAGRARMRPVLTAPVLDAGQESTGLRYALRRATVAGRLLATWTRIAREILTGDYDAVILNCDVDLWPVAAAALLIALVPRRPALAYVGHSVRPYNRWGGEALYAESSLLHALLARLYGRIDLAFVHGEHSRQEWLETWPSTRLAVIPHGDEGLFATEPPPPSEQERVLFFGDWRKVKGLPVLMEAFEQLAERRPHAHLTIAGTPSPADLDPAVVQRFAARYPERVQVIDRYVPLEDVPALFARARVVATPYLVGYQSGVAHLAMTMARAVVTSDVGDLAAAVGSAGLAVPARDPAALAGALERVLADPGLAHRLGQEGRRRAGQESSWPAVAERVESALKGLPGRGRR